jgi:hypothetical protein
MNQLHIKTHTDGIWISEEREFQIVKRLNQAIIDAGFEPVVQNSNNYGYPYIYQRNNNKLNCRLVDSVFQTDPGIIDSIDAVVITDNHPTTPILGRLISLLPELWSIWQFFPEYTDRPCEKHFNCFMNRARPERSIVFYELIKRNLIDQGIVSYNCQPSEYETIFQQADLGRYRQQHQFGQSLIPYNTVENHGTLEQCIIDSKVTLITETYTADTHIVFSEKLFRALQLPRPWLLYCSPGSVEFLRSHGFDVLDDYVDHAYDDIALHHARLTSILDRLETFVVRTYSEQDYERFKQASQHNQKLLQQFQLDWPAKFEKILEEVKDL